MSDFYIHFTLTNETDPDKVFIFSDFVDPDPIPDHLLHDDGTPDKGAIYRELRKEWGVCRSKVYVDQREGPPRHVGWFFVSRQRYEDTGQPYLRGAWCSIIEETPAVRRYA